MMGNAVHSGLFSQICENSLRWPRTRKILNWITCLLIQSSKIQIITYVNSSSVLFLFGKYQFSNGINTLIIQKWKTTEVEMMQVEFGEG